MREKNKKSIASYIKFPQFTTMNVIDGQAGLVFYSSLFFYSLTINNILNIIVLLILAGVAINMLTGTDSAPAKANEASQKNDIGTAKDKVYLDAQDAQTEAYTNVYVEPGTAKGSASITVGQQVIDKIIAKYGTVKTVGKASIQAEQENAQSNGKVRIWTTETSNYQDLSCVGRGGRYNSDYDCTAHRFINPEDAKEYVGFRPIIYISSAGS